MGSVTVVLVLGELSLYVALCKSVGWRSEASRRRFGVIGAGESDCLPEDRT